jgi:WD repeat-containing protein 45
MGLAARPLALVQVRAVKLRRDRIVVAVEHKVLVYNFSDLRLLSSIETLSNPHGLVALSAAAEQTVLACPGLHVGQVGRHASAPRPFRFQLVVWFVEPGLRWLVGLLNPGCVGCAKQVRVELYDVRRTKFIHAHSSGLAHLALSLDGKLLASASERGTLVRIHSTADGSRLQVCLSASRSCRALGARLGVGAWTSPDC